MRARGGDDRSRADTHLHRPEASRRRPDLRRGQRIIRHGSPSPSRNSIKRYGALEVVHGIDLEVADREFIALVGPSGCGKSTTLRMIAGLEDITGGEIEIGDQCGQRPAAARAQHLAMVFQSYALYPHMTVAREHGLFAEDRRQAAGRDRAARRRGSRRSSTSSTLMERRPSQLSGGQRQRVAMGRAIVRNPEVFLFDEPLSNLDAKLRTQMRTEIKKLHARVKSTVIYVTHDQVEAMTLADRIVIMRDGYIEQVGTPEEVFERPATHFVAGFIGSPPMNLDRGDVDRRRIAGFRRRRQAAGAAAVPAPMSAARPEGGLRPAPRRYSTRPAMACTPARRRTCIRPSCRSR